jgi:hypothetical protein
MLSRDIVARMAHLDMSHVIDIVVSGLREAGIFQEAVDTIRFKTPSGSWSASNRDIAEN